MILSDRDIKKALKDGRLKITPAPDFETQLGSCSIDLKLGNQFRIFKNSLHPYIDVKGKIPIDDIMEEITIADSQPFVLHPGELALAVTQETLQISDDLIGRIEGRSSLGRLGIIVHGTASVFEPGWNGKPVMELGNLGVMPVAIYPGMRICAFTFEELSSPAEIPYNKKKNNYYAGQKGPMASQLNKDFEKDKKVG
ncbi:MAG: dCTP deaminase [Candidatus Colwellbacteria bacterium RIFCSPLOWO2_01_FULL_48_10]|uniref:dCTP deaminase n=1 Tax=Candidatus Colwellbacteria bacterium RIFCSPLOWO2_01_FULL_48_10 TaxID=1797690 RepID=A0A1G1Z8P4_9BACT|nr:MAG: dCTP deaminase [Candidatus Colwellbacteria bacterium RIFCSPLOWO2_01_FULL_48_10]